MQFLIMLRPLCHIEDFGNCIDCNLIFSLHLSLSLFFSPCLSVLFACFELLPT